MKVEYQVDFTTFKEVFQYCPGIYLASNRNEYRESSYGVKALPVRKTVKLTAICEPIFFLGYEGFLTS
jgi:hypothetical protein